jgi:hypothetical protein
MISDVLQGFLNTNDILTFPACRQAGADYNPPTTRGAHKVGGRGEGGVPAFSWAPC